MAYDYKTPDVHVTMAVADKFYLLWNTLNFKHEDVAAWDFDNDNWGDFSAYDYFWLDEDHSYDVYFDPENTTEDRDVRLTVTGYDLSDEVSRVVTSVKVYVNLIGTASKPTSYKGWAGSDVIQGSGRAETFDPLAGRDVVYAKGGADVVKAGDGNDEVYGGSGGDVLYGDTGNDRLFGDSDNDKIYGNDGNDYLVGGAGNDTLKGGAGNDMLVGSDGADHLYGGSGKDVFDFNALSNSTLAAAGRDTIFDFSVAQGDDIDVRAIDANTFVKGNQGFKFIGSAKFHGEAGELRYVRTASDTYIYGDANGDKKADFAIHLDDVLTLKSDNFLL